MSEPARSLSDPVASLRVLCVHGFRTNKKILQDQTRDLQRLLGSRADLMFLNGPGGAGRVRSDCRARLRRLQAVLRVVAAADAVVAAKTIKEKTVGRQGEERAFLQYEGLEATM